MSIYNDLLNKYGHIMTVFEIAKEMRIAPGTVRNRRSKGTLPFPTTADAQRIKAKTADVARYLEGE